MSGFIPISRKIFDHEFWQENRPFSRFEAWLDLVQSARFEKDERTDWIKGKPITYGRGQRPASVRFLQKRWGWGSIKRVELFLKYLKNRDMIRIETETGQSVITICKYDSYNPLKNIERQQEDTEGDSKETAKRQQRDKANKDNKGIKNTNAQSGDATRENDFELFWNAYGKKVGKKKCETAWRKLTSSDKTKIMEVVPGYVQDTPKVQFRKDPLKWLTGEHWNDEEANLREFQFKMVM